MRHGDKINNLGRKSAHRTAMLANMACSLIENKRIFTTVAKAKALRTYVEPLLTKGKDDTTHSRRVVFAYLKNKEAVSELFKEVALKIADRKGGYTRIIKTGNRIGDAAEMALIELVDFNEIYSNNKNAAGTEKKAKSTTRRSRSAGTKKAAAKTTETKEEGAE
ncbi:MAG: ribosomal protein [Bacteroidetes bacterium]|jgi:large subunit ribosomal protein L17|nr:ribosomal protein [Bacteroidota bacterium]